MEVLLQRRSWFSRGMYAVLCVLLLLAATYSAAKLLQQAPIFWPGFLIVGIVGAFGIWYFRACLSFLGRLAIDDDGGVLVSTWGGSLYFFPGTIKRVKAVTRVSHGVFLIHITVRGHTGHRTHTVRCGFFALDFEGRDDLENAAAALATRTDASFTLTRSIWNLP